MDRIGVFLRRAAAYAIDYVVIALYAVLLALVTITIAPDVQLAKSQAYWLSVATLTGPVVLVFSGLEARFGVSPGKALLVLRIQGTGGDIPLSRALVRNVGKFLPWELAHIGIWTVPGQPFVDPPTGLNWAIWAMSGGLVLVQILLVSVTGAGLHDRLAGLRVVRRSA